MPLNPAFTKQHWNLYSMFPLPWLSAFLNTKSMLGIAMFVNYTAESVVPISVGREVCFKYWLRVHLPFFTTFEKIGSCAGSSCERCASSERALRKRAGLALSEAGCSPTCVPDNIIPCLLCTTTSIIILMTYSQAPTPTLKLNRLNRGGLLTEQPSWPWPLQTISLIL